MRLKKSIALLLLACMLGAGATSIAYAIEPSGNGVSFRQNWFVNQTQYDVSEAYRTSVWYRNLSALTLTENERNNVLRVAISQLGYHEGDSEADIDGYNENGTGNYVEYMRLVKNAENGSDWCACFVNWCLSQAGVTHAGGEIGCQRWIDDTFKASGRFCDSAYYGGTYTPKPADVIFFDWDENGAWADHVGLVLYVDEATVYTIEGNTKAGNVGLRTYAKDSSFILGYGTPAYNEADEATLDFSCGDGHVAGLYIVRTAQATLTLSDGSRISVPLGTTVTAAHGATDLDTLTVSYDGTEGRMATADLLLLTPDVWDREPSTDGDTETGGESETAVTETDAKTDTETEKQTEKETETVTDEPVDVTTRGVDTAALATVSYWRFAAEVTDINGTEHHLVGYRDPGDRSVRPSEVDAEAAGLTASPTVRLSGWALSNAGQHTCVWSVDGITWHTFQSGTLTRATEANHATAVANAALTVVNLRRGCFNDLTVDLSEYADAYVTLRVGVVPVDEPTAVCHFLTLDRLWVGDAATRPPETDTETDTETETEADTETETETKTETGTETETDTDTSTETVTVTDTDTDTETEAGPETNKETETETDTRDDTETDEDTAGDIPADTGSDTNAGTPEPAGATGCRGTVAASILWFGVPVVAAILLTKRRKA